MSDADSFFSEEAQEKLSESLEAADKRREFINLLAELHRLLDSVIDEEGFFATRGEGYSRFKEMAAPLLEILDNDNDIRMRLVSLVSDMLATGCSDDELAETFSAHVVGRIRRYVGDGVPPPLFYLCALDSVLAYGERRAGEEIQKRFIEEKILPETKRPRPGHEVRSKEDTPV